MENEKQEEMVDFENSEGQTPEVETDQPVDENQTDEVKHSESQVEEEERVRQKEQNRINAERRKKEKAERDAALEKKGYDRAIKESLDGKNPYTHKPINDDVDMEIYNVMKELEKQGKDPLMDYADYVADKARESQKEKLAQKELDDYASNDINSFIESHPDIDVNKVLKDEQFNEFADGKLGKVPLNEIYDKFVKFTSYYEDKSEKDAKERAVAKFARIQSSIGSLENTTKPKKKSYMEMTDEEFDAEYRRITGKN